MFGNLTSFESSLFDDLRRMQRGMEEMFGSGLWPADIRSVAPGSFPLVNVGATSDRVDVYLFAAGVDPGTLDVSIQRNLLTVAGERRLDLPENVEYYRRERFAGAFRRVISLPEDVDPEKVDARYSDGVLQVSIERREATRPRQIEVK